MLQYIITHFSSFFPQLSAVLGSGFLIFVRVLGFMRFCPGLQRSELPKNTKIGFAVMFTIFLIGILKPPAPPADASLVFGIIINYVFGALLGFIGFCIVNAVEAGGDMMNTQMGMSSATVLDPTTSGQVSLMGKLLGLVGLLIFINIGGIYWMLNAFIRSFELFPIYGTAIPFDKFLNLEYLTTITSNILYIGLQFASPILIATLGQDIILGIISKTAPQINVFQLSFLFKPLMGALILYLVMPVLMGIINDYFMSYANIF